MPLPKTVTAQDFMDAAFPVSTSKENFDALLSRARQEARREALKEMDDTWLNVDACLPETFEPLYKLRTEYNQP